MATSRRALALAAAMLVLFGAQELLEAALAGVAVAAVLAKLPLAVLLALPLGLAAAFFVELIVTGGERVALAARRGRIGDRATPAGAAIAGSRDGHPRRTSSPLAFGLARRPPPRLASRTH